MAHLVRLTAGPPRPFRWLRFSAGALALLLSASEAGAAPKDAAALRLDREAMDSDYLANNWSGAETRLRKALRDCGARGCSTKVRAQVQLHLGIILVNAGKTPEASAAFAEALRLNPAAAPENDFANPDVLKAFEEVKQRKAGAPTPPTDAEPPPPPPAADLVHTAVPEQAVGSPVPVYAEADAAVARMVLYYRGGAGVDFNKVEMRRAGKGFRAVVPCGATAAPGAVSYYIITLDAKGEPAGGAGSRSEPFQVAIKAAVEGPPPHFPGEGPLAACRDGATCPPGVSEAGCEAAAAGGVGAVCTDANACGEGLACVEGVCRARGEAGGAATYKKNWLSLTASLDVAIVRGTDLCSLANQRDSGSFACFRDGDDGYRGQPQPGEGGSLSGLVRPGTARFMLGYDRALSPNVLLGARAGYAINGGPKGYYADAFVPVHAELRATYVFGRAALARRGFHPYAYVGGGLGEVNAEVPNVQVEDDCGFSGRPACPANQQRPIITVSAYRRLGRFFGGAGFGALWLFTPSTGVFADVKVSAFGPTAGFAVAPSLGVAQGF